MLQLNNASASWNFGGHRPVQQLLHPLSYIPIHKLVRIDVKLLSFTHSEMLWYLSGTRLFYLSIEALCMRAFIVFSENS